MENESSFDDDPEFSEGNSGVAVVVASGSGAAVVVVGVATQFDAPEAASVPASHASHDPAAVADSPLSLVVPSAWFPQVVWAAQLSASFAAHVPDGHAHEASAVAVPAMIREVPSAWLPVQVHVRTVCAAQLAASFAAHVPDGHTHEASAVAVPAMIRVVVPSA